MSSDVQQTLDDVEAPEPDLEDVPQETHDASAWTPRESNKRRCQNCGGHVTPELRRCYGDDGEVEACGNCADKTKIATWAHHGQPEHDHRRRVTGNGGSN